MSNINLCGLILALTLLFGSGLIAQMNGVGFQWGVGLHTPKNQSFDNFQPYSGIDIQINGFLRLPFKGLYLKPTVFARSIHSESFVSNIGEVKLIDDMAGIDLRFGYTVKNESKLGLSLETGFYVDFLSKQQQYFSSAMIIPDGYDTELGFGEYNRLGFSFGIYCDYHFSPRVFFRIGLDLKNDLSSFGESSESSVISSEHNSVMLGLGLCWSFEKKE